MNSSAESPRRDLKLSAADLYTVILVAMAGIMLAAIGVVKQFAPSPLEDLIQQEYGISADQIQVMEDSREASVARLNGDLYDCRVTAGAVTCLAIETGAEFEAQG